MAPLRRCMSLCVLLAPTLTTAFVCRPQSPAWLWSRAAASSAPPSTTAPRMDLAMREAMSMQKLLDQIVEQLPVAYEEPADASDLRPGSTAVAPQMPTAAEAAEWATAGREELEATPLSLASIRAQAKTILAAKTTPVARQDTLAALADAALRAARPHSAALVFEMGERRAWKARAQGKTGGALLSRELLRVGLLAQVALRRRRGYEALLRHAQQGWELELAEAPWLLSNPKPKPKPNPKLNPNLNPKPNQEPRLLSAAMAACCEAGWLQHALACNETLSASGQTAGVEAHKALMAARLRQVNPNPKPNPNPNPHPHPHPHAHAHAHAHPHPNPKPNPNPSHGRATVTVRSTSSWTCVRAARRPTTRRT